MNVQERFLISAILFHGFVPFRRVARNYYQFNTLNKKSLKRILRTYLHLDDIYTDTYVFMKRIFVIREYLIYVY